MPSLATAVLNVSRSASESESQFSKTFLMRFFVSRSSLEVVLRSKKRFSGSYGTALLQKIKDMAGV